MPSLSCIIGKLDAISKGENSCQHTLAYAASQLRALRSRCEQISRISELFSFSGRVLDNTKPGFFAVKFHREERPFEREYRVYQRLREEQTNAHSRLQFASVAED